MQNLVSHGLPPLLSRACLRLLLGNQRFQQYFGMFTTLVVTAESSVHHPLDVLSSKQHHMLALSLLLFFLSQQVHLIIIIFML